jgi:hypothetical protein
MHFRDPLDLPVAVALTSAAWLDVVLPTQLSSPHTAILNLQHRTRRIAAWCLLQYPRSSSFWGCCGKQQQQLQG